MEQIAISFCPVKTNKKPIKSQPKGSLSKRLAVKLSAKARRARSKTSRKLGEKYRQMEPKASTMMPQKKTEGYCGPRKIPNRITAQKATRNPK